MVMVDLTNQPIVLLSCCVTRPLFSYVILHFQTTTGQLLSHLDALFVSSVHLSFCEVDLLELWGWLHLMTNETHDQNMLAE